MSSYPPEPGIPSEPPLQPEEGMTRMNEDINGQLTWGPGNPPIDPYGEDHLPPMPPRGEWGDSRLIGGDSGEDD